MTSTDPTPTLLPGVAATTWARVAVVASYCFVVPSLALLYNVGFLHNSSSPWLSVEWAGFIAVLLTAFTSALLATRRNGNEVEAGYTTQWRINPTLPQLDARTGVLIRAAGQPYVKRAAWQRGNIDRPVATVALNPGQKPPSAWYGVRALIPSFAIAIVAFPAFAGSMGVQTHDVLQRVLITIPIVIVVYAIPFGIGALVVRARMIRLRAVVPNGIRFLFANSSDYTAGVSQLAVLPALPAGYTARGASADSTGLTVYEGNPFKQVARLEWTDVTSIQVADVPRANNGGTLVLITFKTRAGNLATLPLAYSKLDSFPIPSKAATRWIVDRLNGLCSGSGRVSP